MTGNSGVAPVPRRTPKPDGGRCGSAIARRGRRPRCSHHPPPPPSLSGPGFATPPAITLRWGGPRPFAAGRRATHRAAEGATTPAGGAASPPPQHRPHARPTRLGHATRGSARAAPPPACPRPRVVPCRAAAASTSPRSLTERRSTAPAGPPRIVARRSAAPTQAVDQRPVSVGCAACAQHPERSGLPGQRAASRAVVGLPPAARAGVPWSCPDQPATAAPGRHGSR